MNISGRESRRVSFIRLEDKYEIYGSERIFRTVEPMLGSEAGESFQIVPSGG